MTATVQKWGNSLALRIPIAVAREIRVREGDAVTLKISASGLTLRPVPRHPSLDDLLERVNAGNLHPATEWGRDLGSEAVAP